MFTSVADSFFQMAQKIIADMIKMIVLKSLLGLFGNTMGGGGGGGIFGGLFGGGGGGGSAPSGFGLESLMSGMGSGGGGMFLKDGPPDYSAVFSRNGNILVGGFQAFAQGGVVKRPTLGLVGEGAYNEAIVPLPNGKAIPVDMKGSGGAGAPITTNITVNVNNEGKTDTQMSGDQAGKLSKAIDSAVKRVILEEKRPGGMLSGR
jgi:phage-related minor tail protein